jgi:hypothetical protein
MDPLAFHTTSTTPLNELGSLGRLRNIGKRSQILDMKIIFLYIYIHLELNHATGRFPKHLIFLLQIRHDMGWRSHISLTKWWLVREPELLAKIVSTKTKKLWLMWLYRPSPKSLLVRYYIKMILLRSTLTM